MGENATAEVLARMLAERGWTLGTVECGTGGGVGHRLFDTEDGPAVLGSSLTVNTVEEAIDFLGLPWQQFEKAGDFSAKAARAAARTGRDFLEVDLCLAVWAMPLPAGASQVHEIVHLALAIGQDTIDDTLDYKGPQQKMGNWLADQALEFANKALSRH